MQCRAASWQCAGTAHAQLSLSTSPHVGVAHRSQVYRAVFVWPVLDWQCVTIQKKGRLKNPLMHALAANDGDFPDGNPDENPLMLQPLMTAIGLSLMHLREPGSKQHGRTAQHASRTLTRAASSVCSSRLTRSECVGHEVCRQFAIGYAAILNGPFNIMHFPKCFGRASKSPPHT